MIDLAFTAYSIGSTAPIDTFDAVVMTFMSVITLYLLVVVCDLQS